MKRISYIQTTVLEHGKDSTHRIHPCSIHIGIDQRITLAGIDNDLPGGINHQTMADIVPAMLTARHEIAGILQRTRLA